MGRALPLECPEHAVIVDHGAFGPCQGFCDDVHPGVDDCPDLPGCDACDEKAARSTLVATDDLARLLTLLHRPRVLTDADEQLVARIASAAGTHADGRSR